MSGCDLAHLVDRHFDGRIALEEERRMREHLPACAVCSARYERHLVLARLDPQGSSAHDRLARGLGIPDAPDGEGRVLGALRPASVVLALAAVAGLALFVGRHRGASDEFLARGGSAPAARVWGYRIASGKSSPLGDSVARHDDLAFAYDNPAGRKRLLVFGVDEHRHVYWYHPAWTDPQSSPHAVQISSGRHELPEAIAHDFDGSELTLYAVFTDEPIGVRDAEQAIARGEARFTRDAAWKQELRVIR